MIICLGPVCIPIWHVGMVLIFLFKPLWRWIKAFSGYKEENSTTGEEIVLENNTALGVTLGTISTKDKLSAAIEKAKLLSAPLIIQFGATWCMPCKRIAPKFLELSSRFKCVTGYIDVDCEELESISNGATSLPTFRIYTELSDISLLEKPIAEFIGADLTPIECYFKKLS